MVPIIYTPGFIADPDAVFKTLWATLPWERRGVTPRREVYFNDVPAAYRYGKPPFDRSYDPVPWTPEILAIRAKVEAEYGCVMSVVFGNAYDDSRDSLSWHADDGESMDDAKPIAIISFGAKREICFAPRDNLKDVTRLALEPGSLCTMAPGMQDTHKHKIPRAGYDCGPRISLTFRGYVAA